MEKIKIFEMFSGYGGASFSLKKAGIDFECVGFSEIDKYAIECYNKNHFHETESREFFSPIDNFGDCTKINPNDIPDFDLLTGGFPCPTFSSAGKGLGEKDPRGKLFNEIIRIAEVKKPRYMLLENVKGLTFKTHKETFDKILSELKRIGYYVNWKILTSKEYGIPQSRERVWFFCFRDFEEYNKFKLMEKEELKIFLKDILEEEVDEKYYLSEKQLIKLIEYLSKKKKINEEVINCIGTCFGRSGSSKEELESFSRTNKALILDIYNNKLKKEGICPTLTEPHHNNLRLFEPFILRGRPKMPYKKGERKLEYKPYNICPTLSQNCASGDQKNIVMPFLRKLTPKECFRLMGFLNDEIKLEGLSDRQRYILAGNGWDINLVSKIFKQMFGSQTHRSKE